jgi:hypothetical protein
MKTMKTISCLLVAGILCALPARGPAQTAPFTRITTGPIVSDGGDSFICNWADYDEDGDIDLIIGNLAPPPDYCSSPELQFVYLNLGDGTFKRATIGDIGELATDALFGGQVIWGDYDNDGHLDLFINAVWEPCRLYRGNGDGTFTRIREDVGVNGMWSASTSGTWGSSWVDYDQDGFLDLFVVVA